MHRVDAVTEQMIRSVLAYAENRLRLDPVPLDGGPRDPADLDAALAGLLAAGPHNSDQVLGVFTSVLAPAAAGRPRWHQTFQATARAGGQRDHIPRCWISFGSFHQFSVSARLVA